MNFYQIVLPIFTLAFLLQVFVVQSWIQYKKTGIKPYVFGHSDNAHDFCGKIYKFMILFTWVSIGFYSFFPYLYEYILPVRYLEIDWLQHIGFGLTILSFVWIIVAQKQMNASWRIGIDYDEKTELIQSGLFARSRNPIFFGILLSYLGTFLVIPNALSFSTFLLTYVTMQIQIRLEEEYLENVHGESYIKYKNIVRRWI